MTLVGVEPLRELVNASMGPRRMAVDDHGRAEFIERPMGKLQWGHGAWPWMTEERVQVPGAEAKLQWGHGAWPWMTIDRCAPPSPAVPASMGPRRMAWMTDYR